MHDGPTGSSQVENLPLELVFPICRQALPKFTPEPYKSDMKKFKVMLDFVLPEETTQSSHELIEAQENYFSNLARDRLSDAYETTKRELITGKPERFECVGHCSRAKRFVRRWQKD